MKITLKFQSSIGHGLLQNKSRTFQKLQNICEIDSGRGSCPSSSPSGNQVDGSPLVAIKGKGGKRASRLSLAGCGCAPTRASRSSEETTEIDTEKKRKGREREPRHQHKHKNRNKGRTCSASRTRHQKQELKRGPKLDENTDAATKTQNFCFPPFSGSPVFFHS